MDKKKILSYSKNIGAYFGASLIPMVLNLIANPFISMNMSPEDFAITGYFSSFSSLLLPIISFYFLHFYNKRYFECNEEERHVLKATLFKLLIVYSLFASILCIIGVFGYIKIFNSGIQFDIFPYLPLAILSIPLTGIYNLELTDYKMQKKSKSYYNLAVAAGVINTLVVVLMVVALKMAAFGKLLAPVVVNLGIFIYLFIKHRDLWAVHVDKSYIKEIFIFCWPLALADMFGYFTNGFDKTFLESVGDVTEYGYYCVASSIAAYLYVFSTAVYNTFTPDLYEAISQHNNKKMLRTVGVEFCMNSVVVAAFILFCPFVIYVLTAGRYMESIPYTRVLALTTIFQTFNYCINIFTIAKGYTRISLARSILGSILIVLTMYLFVKRWSYIGGAWAVSISSVILFGVNFILLAFVAGKNKSIAYLKSLFNAPKHNNNPQNS